MLPPPLAERLTREGSLSFATFLELALYDPEHGFYATGGRAGGRGDFLTSPEVGPLFGAVIGLMLDQVWESLGRPDPFVVADVGAGPGTLARSVRIAAPRCSPALVYLLVERSAPQRGLHGAHLPGWVGEREGDLLERAVVTPVDGRGPKFVSAAALPSALTGVIVANELLDNLPFDIVRRRGPVIEEMVVVAADGELEFDTVPASPAIAATVGNIEVDDDRWFPRQQEARNWVDDALQRLQGGRLLVLDYGDSTASLAARPDMAWLRTYRSNARGGHPLDAPGSQDITTDVALDQVQRDHPATRMRSQATFLRDHGLDALVEAGRRIWTDRAAAPDLVAIRARSRVGEADALTDVAGLGSFAVLEWDVGPIRGS